MELTTLHKRVIRLDIHQAQITACAITEKDDGTCSIERRQFGTFKRDRRALSGWAAALRADLVAMVSTGIYWKIPYAALEAAGLRLLVVRNHFFAENGAVTPWTDSIHGTKNTLRNARL